MEKILISKEERDAIYQSEVILKALKTLGVFEYPEVKEFLQTVLKRVDIQNKYRTKEPLFPTVIDEGDGVTSFQWKAIPKKKTEDTNWGKYLQTGYTMDEVKKGFDKLREIM